MRTAKAKLLWELAGLLELREVCLLLAGE